MTVLQPFRIVCLQATTPFLYYMKRKKGESIIKFGLISSSMPFHLLWSLIVSHKHARDKNLLNSQFNLPARQRVFMIICNCAELSWLWSITTSALEFLSRNSNMPQAIRMFGVNFRFKHENRRLLSFHLMMRCANIGIAYISGHLESKLTFVFNKTA